MYLWVKAFHIVAVISWMAGLLYLPRLFVYHVENPHMSSVFEVMQRRLLKFIMTPALIVSWVLGLYLVFDTGSFSQGWMHIKLLFVVFLTFFHLYLAYIRKKLLLSDHNYTSSYFRKINEVPTLFMIIIVIMAVVKPF